MDRHLPGIFCNNRLALLGPAAFSEIRDRQYIRAARHGEILKGINLVVMRRELLFLIGRPAPAKSTLLLCCNRLEEQNAGTTHTDAAMVTSTSVCNTGEA